MSRLCTFVFVTLSVACFASHYLRDMVFGVIFVDNSIASSCFQWLLLYLKFIELGFDTVSNSSSNFVLTSVVLRHNNFGFYFRSVVKHLSSFVTGHVD